MDHLWLKESQAHYESINNKHDKGYKYLLSAKKVFLELLRSFIKQGWVEQIDENKIVRVDKSFILQDFKDKEADLVYWVRLNDKDVIFYILMEMQSTVDFQMPYRLLLYMVEIWRGFIKDAENEEKLKGFRLPAVVPVVLYNGANNWTACRSYREYLSGYEMFGNNIVDFTYILVDVNRYTEEELLELSNVIAAAFLIDQKKDMNGLLERLKKVVDILKRMDLEEFELFKNWFVNIIMRDSEGEQYKIIEKVILESKESESMVYNFETALKEELLKSEEKGIEKGLKKGMEKGIDKKAVLVAKKALLKGLDLSIIAEIAELPIEEVEKIKKELNQQPAVNQLNSVE